MPDARQEIRTRASCERRHPAYEVRACTKNREYNPISFGSALEASVNLPSARASFKQRG
jgi:hypothetical protein